MCIVFCDYYVVNCFHKQLTTVESNINNAYLMIEAVLKSSIVHFFKVNLLMYSEHFPF